MNKYLRSATRTINTSLPIEISDADFEKILTSGATDMKWSYHIKIFLEEAPIELIHNLVLSGTTNFKILEKLFSEYANSSKKRSWIHEMAKYHQ